ncbi:hypothetical protein AKUH3B209X_PPKS00140 (plasmid) [Apilactobacillus kunkeei]|uniref:acyl carrier protein n=1 Tax=Apilactobacillus waqarii TaxID=2851006 RepID=UPI0021E27005|nr:hypothetical protein AKUH4B403J_PPKS00140 [Apilactobacillus kunkeei]CAI2672797.1 hypothetical protein AKUH4B103J_PPKS00140 [Apilactobacillus kunkeei]CAI2673433.1 hypothetical protein AKUH4B203M_PPKS00140 [Apilactobacillus kunkeei]CAI2675137.1 hypothetical protein AKUH4B116J_PPKS00140 [Apilactobacillus kunkeei]CAI2675463.1 hypothetical protein AKUH4B303J_PPKS00140 [Apilactobacillus kunkeei]
MNSIEFLQDRLIDMGFDKKEFDLNIDLRNELGLDSAELVDLTLSIEEKYGFDIDFSEIDHLSLYEISKIIDNNI